MLVYGHICSYMAIYGSYMAIYARIWPYMLVYAFGEKTPETKSRVDEICLERVRTCGPARSTHSSVARSMKLAGLTLPINQKGARGIDASGMSHDLMQTMMTAAMARFAQMPNLPGFQLLGQARNAEVQSPVAATM